MALELFGLVSVALHIISNDVLAYVIWELLIRSTLFIQAIQTASIWKYLSSKLIWNEHQWEVQSKANRQKCIAWTWNQKNQWQTLK